MSTNPFSKKSLQLHKKHKGKIGIAIKTPIQDRADLNMIYTPGVGAVAQEIFKNKKKAYEYTSKQNSVAIISDGSAVLGFGNLGPEAALPILEGKSVIFKKFAGIDAFPIVLATQDAEEIIRTIKAISPTFGAIQLEDISAPRCFEIEERLQKELSIPVMHDDQHGTAIVVLAALINALRVVRKGKDARIVISGAGSAGIATLKLLATYGLRNITMTDSRGVISKDRKNLEEGKRAILRFLKPGGEMLADALRGADVFIGVSAPNIVTAEMVTSMNQNAIVFALANPTPEIMPHLAKKGGAKIVATGRSDFPNQINNALAYPGIFRGLLDYGIKKVAPELKIRVAEAIASLIKKPTEKNIIPSIFDKRLVKAVKSALR